jgi:hypothetical protein
MPGGTIGSVFHADGLNVDRAVNFYDINKDHQVSQSEFELTLGVTKDVVSLPAGVNVGDFKDKLQAWIDHPETAPVEIRDKINTLAKQAKTAGGIDNVPLGSISEAVANAAIKAINPNAGGVVHTATDTPIKRDDFINMMKARGMQTSEAAQLFDTLNTDKTATGGEQFLTKAEADAAFATVANGGEVSQYDDAERLALASLGVREIPNKTLKDYVAYPGNNIYGIAKFH